MSSNTCNDPNTSSANLNFNQIQTEATVARSTTLSSEENNNDRDLDHDHETIPQVNNHHQTFVSNFEYEKYDPGVKETLEEYNRFNHRTDSLKSNFADDEDEGQSSSSTKNKSKTDLAQASTQAQTQASTKCSSNLNDIAALTPAIPLLSHQTSEGGESDLTSQVHKELALSGLCMQYIDENNNSHSNQGSDIELSNNGTHLRDQGLTGLGPGQVDEHIADMVDSLTQVHLSRPEVLNSLDRTSNNCISSPIRPSEAELRPPVPRSTSEFSFTLNACNGISNPEANSNSNLEAQDNSFSRPANNNLGSIYESTKTTQPSTAIETKINANLMLLNTTSHAERMTDGSSGTFSGEKTTVLEAPVLEAPKPKRNIKKLTPDMLIIPPFNNNKNPSAAKKRNHDDLINGGSKPAKLPQTNMMPILSPNLAPLQNGNGSMHTFSPVPPSMPSNLYQNPLLSPMGGGSFLPLSGTQTNTVGSNQIPMVPRENNSNSSARSAKKTHLASLDPTKFKRSDQRKVSKEDFLLKSTLGKGGYGKVFQVIKTTGIDKGQIYAMKTIRKAKLMKNKTDEQHSRSERKILEAIHHPFIVHLNYAFQTEGKLYLVMEYLPGGELFKVLDDKGPNGLSEEWTIFYAAEIG